MKITIIKISVIGLIFFLYSCSDRGINCTVKGTVIDRDSDTIYLLKATEDARFTKTYIPIIDDQFEYEFATSQVEAYQLIFHDEHQQGAWRPIIFFAEEGMVQFILHPADRFDENAIKGGLENEDYTNYLKTFESIFSLRFQPLYKKSSDLFDSGEYHSDKMNEILIRLRATENQDSLSKIYTEMRKLRDLGEDKSTEAMNIQDDIERINEEAILWQYNYMQENLSIAMYFLLIQDLSAEYARTDQKEEQIKRVFPDLTEKFPDHPYTELANDLIKAMSQIAIGEKFVEFSAPSLSGEMVRLSDVISQHKILLLDLWASWCGPCISKAKSMVPVYNEYKDKGFGILGVAREFENTTAMVRIMELHGFTWPNLVDLDDNNKIWQKYDIPFSGGGTFLILNNGEIIAIDPSADEVRDQLERLLN